MVGKYVCVYMLYDCVVTVVVQFVYVAFCYYNSASLLADALYNSTIALYRS